MAGLDSAAPEDFTAAVERLKREKEEQLHGLSITLLQSLEQQNRQQRLDIAQLQQRDKELLQTLHAVQSQFGGAISTLSNQNSERMSVMMSALQGAADREQAMQEEISRLKQSEASSSARMDQLRQLLKEQQERYEESQTQQKEALATTTAAVDERITKVQHSVAASCLEFEGAMDKLGNTFDETFRRLGGLCSSFDQIKRWQSTVDDRLQTVQRAISACDQRQQALLSTVESKVAGISEIVEQVKADISVMSLDHSAFMEETRQMHMECEQQHVTLKTEASAIRDLVSKMRKQVNEELLATAVRLQEGLRDTLAQNTSEVLSMVDGVRSQQLPVPQSEPKSVVDASTLTDREHQQPDEEVRRQIEALEHENSDLKTLIKQMRDAVESGTTAESASDVLDHVSDTLRHHTQPPSLPLQATAVDTATRKSIKSDVSLQAELLRVQAENAKLTAFSNVLQAQLRHERNKPVDSKATQTRGQKLYPQEQSALQSAAKPLQVDQDYESLKRQISLTQLKKPQRKPAPYSGAQTTIPAAVKLGKTVVVRNWNTRDDPT